jgi:hypothetical protein
MGHDKGEEATASQGSYVSRKQGVYVDVGGSLPLNYEDNKIVILPRDPVMIYAYWEINESKKTEVKERFGKDIFQKIPYILRFYDVTNIDFNGLNAHRFFDIELPSGANNWYININESGKGCCVDIGLHIPGGDFFVLARSNIITLPTGRISDIADEEWMMVKGDFEKLMRLVNIEKIGKSSVEVKRRLFEEMKEIISVSSPGISSLGIWNKTETNGFWFVANAELTICGATQSDAVLSVQGKEVPLKPDGTFSLRMALPDGCQQIPIKAVSKNRKEKRDIKIIVNCQTN